MMLRRASELVLSKSSFLTYLTYLFSHCTTTLFLGNMGHARGAAAVRAAKKDGTNVAIGVLAIQLGKKKIT